MKHQPKIMRRERHKTYQAERIIAFLLTLAVFFVTSFILPLRPSYSDFEKRDLTQFPAFSVSSLFDGSYFSNIDLWFSDTFPFRDTFITANSYIKQLYGIQPVQVSGNVEEGDAIPSAPVSPPSAPDSSVSETPSSEPPAESEPSSSGSSETPPPAPEIDVTGEVTQSLGAVLIVGDSGYEYYNFSRETADQYIGLLNRAAQKLNGTAKVYDMVVPTSMDIILPESFRQGLNTSSQKDAIQYMYGSLSPQVHSINVYDILKAHADEYIYYRTDHHWTSLGAYYAYSEFAKLTGFTPLELSQYEAKDFPGFLGAFYSDTKKNPALTKNPDTVTAYVPPGDISMTFTDKKGSEYDWPLISDVSSWAASSKYSTFIGGDNPYTIIKNADITDGSSCLIIKESYGNAFVPFLASQYQTVHVIDYRYWKGNIPDFVKAQGIQNVLFLNNVSATRNASLIGKMDSLIP